MMAPDQQSDAPLPASLVLRLAEAVDGYRDGKPRWFLVSRKPPHDLKQFTSAEAAQSALRKKRDHVVLGPYVAGEAPAKTGRRKKGRRIKSIEIYYEGSKKPVKLDPANVDAIFLSASALDKFVYPYYSRVRGVAAAARMREQHMAAGEEFFHEPLTGP